MGGLNLRLGDQIISELVKSGFEAVRATTRLRGDQAENICNRGRSGQGLQLEITERLRRSMFQGLDRESRRVQKPAFRNFVTTIRQVLLSEGGHKIRLWSW